MQLFLSLGDATLAQVALAGVDDALEQVGLPPVVPRVEALAQRARVGYLNGSDERSGHTEDAVHEGVGDADGRGLGVGGGAFRVLAHRCRGVRGVGRRLGIHGALYMCTVKSYFCIIAFFGTGSSPVPPGVQLASRTALFLRSHALNVRPLRRLMGSPVMGCSKLKV